MFKIESIKQIKVTISAILLCILIGLAPLSAQKTKTSSSAKKISPNLFGLFFEDINYAADGGLYAELIQNRSFEYTPADRKEWHALSFWDYLTPGFSYGSINVETKNPIHENNPHYLVLHAEHVGKEGVGIKNKGFGNMIVKKGQSYNFSMHSANKGSDAVTVKVMLQNPKGHILDWKEVTMHSKDWKKYDLQLRPTANCDSTEVVIMAVTPGTIALDVISLFPANTYKNRQNGLRADLAGLLADMKPAFIRFPGGCLVHGDGIGNMYRWKYTVGPIEQRKAQKNLWGYHQTAGLGYFEYFQFCEDIGAEPLPVLPAAVSCQNSGGTWRTGGNGQQALPLEEMDDYIQEVSDLVEWANGPATSKWGSIRAAAGHPEPFNLKYIGVGNEDKMTPEFEERFAMIYKAVKTKHPEIEIVGSSGPFYEGEDFEKGWEIAKALDVDVIDEHYYVNPDWFIKNTKRYDSYDRKGSKVYLGEYASWGNKLRNAIAEASFMTGLERNGDIVELTSYAPLFAKKGNTQWRTDMIFFDNSTAILTPNYHVQKMFSANSGDFYLSNIISSNLKDTTLTYSAVTDAETGDLILKFVNTGDVTGNFNVNLSTIKGWQMEATNTVITGDPEAENSFEHPENIKPTSSTFSVKKNFIYEAPASSLSVIRIKVKSKS